MSTVSFDGTVYAAKPKPFAWSYSKLKNFEVCPKRHYNVDVIKAFKEEEGEALQWGNAVHKALADRCGPRASPLPHTMKGYEKWAARVTSMGNGPTPAVDHWSSSSWPSTKTSSLPSGSHLTPSVRGWPSRGTGASPTC